MSRVANIPAYPLCWPDRLPRSKSRRSSSFKTGLPGALKNVQDSLRLFAADSGKRIDHHVISANASLGVNNPSDPGVAVWFTWDGLDVCFAVDRYDKVQDNLQAIHHILEARRTELRHGGIDIVRATFTGFLALPGPAPARHWTLVLEVPGTATLEQIRAQYKKLAAVRHPDAGGTHEAMSELNAAWEQAQQAKA